VHVANYFLQGEVTHSGLPQWLAEQTGLWGNEPEAVRLVIWINSSGGDVLAAIESINLMRSSPIPITTVISGCAESAALLVAIAGHRRLIFERSWGMAHHFSTTLEGSYHDLADSLKHNELLNDVMLDIFKEHSDLTSEEISSTLLSRKTNWLSSKELKKLGLVDEILKPGSSLFERLLNGGTKKGKSSSKKKEVSETG